MLEHMRGRGILMTAHTVHEKKMASLILRWDFVFNMTLHY